MRSALLIFIKNPTLGKVKTRLAKSIGDYNALKIYQFLLSHTMEITFELDSYDKFLFYNEFVPTKDDWPVSKYQKELQKGDNLGDKMKNAFKMSFDEDYGKVVLIMPDCPRLTDTIVEKAFKALGSNDFILGPTNDGGYYMIGMRGYYPSVFENKKYSTGSVLKEAIDEMTKLGKTHFILPELVDVDLEDDLGKLRKMIQSETVAEDLENVDPDAIAMPVKEDVEMPPAIEDSGEEVGAADYKDE